MIIHRTGRDVARCRRKYGEAWTRYEKEVPYLFIPVSVLCSLCSSRRAFFVFPMLTSSRSTSSERSSRWVDVVAAQAGRTEKQNGVHRVSHKLRVPVWPVSILVVRVRCIRMQVLPRVSVCDRPASQASMPETFQLYQDDTTVRV
jgi:hypothetical protein